MTTERTGQLRETLASLRDSPERREVREVLPRVARELSKTPENLALFRECLEMAAAIADSVDRAEVMTEVTREIPAHGVYSELFAEATDKALDVADSFTDHQRRITELLKVADRVPGTAEFSELRRRAWRLALGLADKPRHEPRPLEEIASELPKASDLDFYRRYTILGIAQRMPFEPDFHDLYREAVDRAIEAVSLLDEPYYQKYALLYIAGELPDRPEVRDIYIRAMHGALSASFEIKDPFAKQHALIDMLRVLPKTEDFFPVLMDLVARSLAFFTVRRWMEDVEVTDVVDFILSAPDQGLKESKKRRYSREKYARYLARELEDFGTRLNDVRFIEVLKPYTHVWVQPKMIRDSVKKVLDHLDGLTRAFHGREVLRPVFISERHPEGTHTEGAVERAVAPGECIAIDLGATNTVVMKKRGASPPDFVELEGITREMDGARTIPTVLSAETDSIGAGVIDESAVTNIKQMMLDGNPLGAEHMERYFRVLYLHLKRSASTQGWLNILPRSITDKLYITVPLGFSGYRERMRGIVARNVKGGRPEFIDEPLAAAVGYEVAEKRDKLILVVDFGGSTLDMMLLRLNLDEVHVVARPERAQVLGGYDIDVWLAEHLAERAGVSFDNMTRQLMTRAEEVKIGLSRHETVPFEWNGRRVGDVTREEFEELLNEKGFYDTVDRTVSYVLKKAEKVGVRKGRVEAVLLTGGSSQIPSFKDKIGYIFPELRDANYIYDHSPLTAVGRGAALYGTKDVIDRHLGMAYAVRYCQDSEKESPFGYTIVMEKGESLPFEKTFRMKPAAKLGPQGEFYIELSKVPESLIFRRWVREEGLEFIKQELIQDKDLALEPMKTVTLNFDESLGEGGDGVEVTFIVDESGSLTVRYGPDGKTLSTGLRLQ